MQRGSSKGPGRDVLKAGDYEALASFRAAVRRYLAFAERGARAAGLTAQQHQALLAIRAQTFTRPMSIGDLAGQLLIKHHSAVELVGRLQKAGLTQRAVDEVDRRKVLVSLTRQGEEVLASLSANNLKELQVAAPAFSGLLARLAKLDSD